MAAGKAWIPWAEAVDRNTGRKYWWHRETKETTWRNPLPKCIDQKATQLFQQFDKDGGGSISTEELAGALGELDIRVTEGQLKLLVLRYDEDKSGELDCDEWRCLVRDAVASAEGNPDLKSLMQFYAKRMPLKDVKRAKGYPDPPTRVCCAGDEDGCAVWWTPPEERANTKPPIGYIVKRYRKEHDGSWCFKGETEFMNATCSQRIEEMKPKQQYRFTVTTLNELGRSIDSEPSNHTRREVKLPEPWQEFYDETQQQYYYHNKVTGVRAWQRPDQDPLYVDTEVFVQFTPQEMENIKKVYVEVDYDYSGAIDRAELESVLPKLGERLYQRDIDYLYFHCDDDQSGELDFQEFVKMLLKLKSERMARKSFKERMKDRKDAIKDFNTRPRIGNEKLEKMIPEPNKKMGKWNKIFHPTVGRCYYHNIETGAIEWDMPAEIKFYISQELNDSLMTTFDPADILEFEEKFELIDIDRSGCIDPWEFKQLLGSMGERVTDARVKSLMDEVDKDGSGEIDFDEFCIMMQAYKGKGGTLGRLASKIDKEVRKSPSATLHIRHTCLTSPCDVAHPDPLGLRRSEEDAREHREDEKTGCPVGCEIQEEEEVSSWQVLPLRVPGV